MLFRSTSRTYKERLGTLHAIQSMSSVGKCYDNTLTTNENTANDNESPSQDTPTTNTKENYEEEDLAT